MNGPALPTQDAKQLPDTAPGPYYISVMRDDGQVRLLSGPHSFHAEALDLVDKAGAIAAKIDIKAVWYAYGTVRMQEGFAVPGVLQKLGYSLSLDREAA